MHVSLYSNNGGFRLLFNKATKIQNLSSQCSISNKLEDANFQSGLRVSGETYGQLYRVRGIQLVLPVIFQPSLAWQVKALGKRALASF